MKQPTHFDNVFNFRDLGGYPTKDGQVLKSGRLFRSGAFSAPTKRDLVRFSQLDIRLLVDLRSELEKKQTPNQLPLGSQHQTLNVPVWPDATNDVERALLAGTIREFVAKTSGIEPDTPGAMKSFYRSYVRDHSNVWSRLLHRLVQPNAHPALVHCAGGKDRTGVAVAIVLLTLGVSREVVVQDYLFTNSAVEAWIVKDHPEGLPAFFLSVMQADASYLDAAFAEIDSRFESFDNYLRDGLQLSEAEQESLKASFLTRG